MAVNSPPMLIINISIPDAGEEAAQKEGRDVVRDEGERNTNGVND